MGTHTEQTVRIWRRRPVLKNYLVISKCCPPLSGWGGLLVATPAPGHGRRLEKKKKQNHTWRGCGACAVRIPHPRCFSFPVWMNVFRKRDRTWSITHPSERPPGGGGGRVGVWKHAGNQRETREMAKPPKPATGALSGRAHLYFNFSLLPS